MKYPFASIALTAILITAADAQAQPANQYNDSYQDHRYGQWAKPTLQNQRSEESPIWFGGPPAQRQHNDTVVGSPVGQDRPLTNEELRNVKPMGMYIDAPRPLPRGGNQPLPEVPQSTPGGDAQWQPTGVPGAVEGYSGGSGQ